MTKQVLMPLSSKLIFT